MYASGLRYYPPSWYVYFEEVHTIIEPASEESGGKLYNKEDSEKEEDAVPEEDRIKVLANPILNACVYLSTC